MAVLPPPSPLLKHRPGVWLKESWLRFSGFTLQTRMTVIRLDEGLLLHSPSPVPLLPEARREIEALGAPRYLVAPNEIHNVGLVGFQQAYPEAHTTGCVGHPKRVPHARFDVLLDAASRADTVPWTRSGELEFCVIGGNPRLHEIVLFHRASKTLVLTDAVEFIDADRHVVASPFARAAMPMMKTVGFRLGAPCMSPEHHMLCSDPAAVGASLEVIERWDYDCVIIAHGRVLEGDRAREAVHGAFVTTIRAAERRSGAARALWSLVWKLGGGA